MSLGTGAMPQAVAEVYDFLKRHLVNIHVRWTIYRQLFGANPERIDLLNRFGGVAFGVMQRVMQEEAILALCRMSDPAQTGGGKKVWENCTFERLVNLVRDGATTPAELERLGRLESSLATINRVRTDYLVEARNRVLAHLDLETALGKAKNRPDILWPARAHIETFLEAARGLMNAAQRRYEDAETHYGEFNLPSGKDGNWLISHLGDLASRNDAEGDPYSLLHRPRPGL
jgi:AbiU2